MSWRRSSIASGSCARAAGSSWGRSSGRVAGMASVERRFRGASRDRVKMDILYVSAPFRGQGVARELVERAQAIARAMGARFLYVSATPSRHTVDFYLCCGARLAAEVDPELLELEPEDIHLELPLGDQGSRIP